MDGKEYTPEELNYLEELRQADPEAAEQLEAAREEGREIDTINGMIAVAGDPTRSILIAMKKAAQELGKINSDIKEYHGIVMTDSDENGDGTQINTLAKMALSSIASSAVGISAMTGGGYYSGMPRMNNGGSPFRPPKTRRGRGKRRR